MKEYLDWLGYKCRDRVTGYEGVVDSVSFDLYGCVQAGLMPELDDKKEVRPGKWFDIKRLVRLSDARVMSAPEYQTIKPGQEIGPADKECRI
jgi:hypothetical protein